MLVASATMKILVPHSGSNQCNEKTPLTNLALCLMKNETVNTSRNLEGFHEDFFLFFSFFLFSCS